MPRDFPRVSPLLFRLTLFVGVGTWLFVSTLTAAGADAGNGGDGTSRIEQIEDQIKAIQPVIAESQKPSEKEKLQNKLDLLQQELTLLKSREALESKEAALRAEQKSRSITNLRDALRESERDETALSTAVTTLTARLRELSTAHADIKNRLREMRNDPKPDSAAISELNEQFITLEDQIVAVGLQRDTEDYRLQRLHEAQRINADLRVTAPPDLSIRSIVDARHQLSDLDKRIAGLHEAEFGLVQNAKMANATATITKQEASQIDEDIALLSQQTGFFHSEPQIVKLLNVARGQKKYLGQRIPVEDQQTRALLDSLTEVRGTENMLELESQYKTERLHQMESSYFRRLVWPLVGLLLASAAFWSVSRFILPRFYRNESLFLARRMNTYLAITAAGLIIIGFFFADLRTLATTLGIVSAALVISLGDLFSSLAGWFLIIAARKFQVGDRIEVDEHVGDIIDIELTRTTLLECNNWLGTDQPTGRIMIFPNSFIFRSKVFNASHAHPYIWSKLDIMVTFETPAFKAGELLRRVLEEETTEVFEKARHAALAMERRYGVPDAEYKPKVLLSIADSGVNFRLLFVCHCRAVSQTQNRLVRRLLEEIEKDPSIQLAYPTQRIIPTRAVSGPSAATWGA